MSKLTKQYETARKNSIEFMKLGQINAYFTSLLEMKKYKTLMTAVISN